MTSRATVEVDLAAIRHNVRLLRAAAPDSALCAVVKADAYGHGAVAVARAALAAGATWLAVAQAKEGVALRRAGLAGRILLLSEPLPFEDELAIEAELSCVVYSAAAAARLAHVAARHGRVVPVHLKVDTGMRRVGVQPAEAPALARLVVGSPSLLLEGVMTHWAVADDPAEPFTATQLQRFDEVLDVLAGAGLSGFVRHAANSAAAIAHPASRYDLIRPGIALYGVPPCDDLAGALQLRRALTLRTTVTFLKRVRAGEGISYGLRQSLRQDTVVATLPLGYADGVRRGIGLGRQAVLIGGRRCPIVGVVTMDQLMVDCGPSGDVRVGDEAVLLGAQGDDQITVEEWARQLATIGYEVLTGLGQRLDRVYLNGG